MKSIKLGIDWTISPNHIMVLSSFVKPNSVDSVSEYYVNYVSSLKESLKSAIERFINDKALVEATPEEKIAYTFKQSQLKQLLGRYENKTSGTKIELATRLYKYNCEELSRALSVRVMKCSEEGINIIDKFYKLKNDSHTEAKNSSYKAFCNGDAKTAFNIYKTYCKQFNNYYNNGTVSFVMDIFNAKPQFLSKLSPSEANTLRISLAMVKLWEDEVQSDWLYSEVSVSADEFERLSNHLIRHIEIKWEVGNSEDPTEKYKIHFDYNDIDSCQLCLAFKDKVFNYSDLPDFPMLGCTSDMGCQCKIYPDYDEEEYEDFTDELEEQTSSSYFESASDHLDPVAQLQKIQDLLDKGLIDSEEYTEIRKRILQRL